MKLIFQGLVWFKMLFFSLNHNTIGSFVFEDGPIWKERRRFGLGALRSFGMGKKSIEHSINEEARNLLDCFADQAGKPFDPTHLVNNAVSNIICKICFGYRFNYSDPKFAELIARLRENLTAVGPASLTNSFAWLLYTPFYSHVLENIKFMKEFIQGIIQVRNIHCLGEILFNRVREWEDFQLRLKVLYVA